MPMNLSLSLLLGSSVLGTGGGVVPSLTLDFVNTIYERNGTLYPAMTDVPGVTFTRASAGYDLKGSVSFATDVPRITVDGLLLESAATNLIIQSKLASGWSAEQGTITANNDTAPDGTTTGMRVKEDATAAVDHGVFRQQGAQALVASRYVASAFAKRAVGTRNVQLQIFDNGFAGLSLAGFDLSNGNVSLASFAANGWTAGVASSYAGGQSFYRVANSFVSQVETGLWAFLRLLNGTTESYTGDNTSALSAWGIQLELAAAGGYFQNNPSSMIATGAAATTRSADVFSVNVPTGKISATLTYSDATTQNVAVTGGGTLNVASTVAAHVASNSRAPVLQSITFA